MTPTKTTGTREFDTPGRHRWLPQSEIMDVVRIQPGMSIAELGADRSDLTLPISQAVGPAGHVFAVENAPQMLARLRENAEGCTNIHIVEAPHHRTPIATCCCDRVFMANLWAELPHPLAALREAARLLRDNGRLILVEWQAVADCQDAPDARIGFRDMVRLLDRSTWDIHGHGDLGPYS